MNILVGFFILIFIDTLYREVFRGLTKEDVIKGLKHFLNIILFLLLCYTIGAVFFYITGIK